MKNALLGLFGMLIVLAVLAVGCEWAQIRLLSRMQIGDFTEEEVQLNDLRIFAAGIGQILVSLTLTVVFLCWFYRLHANLRCWQAQGLSCTSGWAVGYWFIPLVNLVRPPQIAGEIWRASDPELPVPVRVNWKQGPGTPLIGLWWGSFLVMRILDRLVTTSMPREPDIARLINFTWLQMLSEVVTILACVVAMRLIVAFDRRQTERAATQEQAESTVPPPLHAA